MLMGLDSHLQNPIIGGCCLGIASATVMLYTGGVLGVSGLIRGAISQGRKPEQLGFIAAFLIGSWIAKQLQPSAFVPLPQAFSLARAGLGGIMVGAGAAVGGGCTSGHGICGISRLAVRSLTFIAVAMFTGVLVASMSSTAKAVSSPAAAAAAATPVSDQLKKLTAVSLAILLVAPPVYRASCQKPDHASGVRMLVYTAAGFVFALGLAISGMTSAANVVAFLTPASCSFDISLAFVMAFAVGVAILPHQMVYRWKLFQKPLLVGNSFSVAPTAVDQKLLIGGVLFGAGWGATGLCPGPAIANLVVPSKQLWIAVLAMLLGMRLANLGFILAKGVTISNADAAKVSAN